MISVYKYTLFLFFALFVFTGCTFIKVVNPNIKSEEGKVIFQEEIISKDKSVFNGPILTNLFTSLIDSFGSNEKMFTTKIETVRKIYTTTLNQKIPYGSVVTLTLNAGVIEEIKIVKINKEEYSF